MPGIELTSSELEACSLNHWTRELPVLLSEDIALFFFFNLLHCVVVRIRCEARQKNTLRGC